MRRCGYNERTRFIHDPVCLVQCTVQCIYMYMYVGKMFLTHALLAIFTHSCMHTIIIITLDYIQFLGKYKLGRKRA